MRQEDGAVLSSPRHFMTGGSGKWAGEKMMAAILNGGQFSPDALRTLDLLQRDEWKHFDNVLVEGAVARLKGVSYFIGKGLVIDVPNSMAKTVYEYETVSDLEDAAVSLDGITRDMNDTIDFASAGLPLPITHKDWYLNLRRLQASRERGEPLDTTHIRLAGRKIAEKSEEMLYRGGKTFGGLTIYGLGTHPNRNLASFGTNGPWDATLKTGDNILADVQTLLSAAQDKPVKPEQTAEQAYKNIQVLKGMPASQLDAVMAFFTGSLGVKCNHCHIPGQFEKDDKPTFTKVELFPDLLKILS